MTSTNITPLIFTGTFTENGSGIALITINGVSASISGNTYSAIIPLSEGANAVSIIAIDNAGNTGANSTTINLDVTAPPPITNLQSIVGTTWINWTWTNPLDPNFNYNELYLNGTFITNILAPQNYYNATGLLPDTSYELSTRTVDTLGNISQTWVNDTATTTIISSDGITGIVANETGSPIAGVMVKLTAYPQYNSTTTGDGRYIINNVPDGTYNLTATKEPEYYPNSSVIVNVISGGMAVQDIELVKKLTGTLSGNVAKVTP